MEEIGLVQLANEVLARLPDLPRVEHWTQINAGTFVKLYEGLFAEALPDVIRHPRGKEDEIHNVQSVIDTLSLDILNTSLSHLSGEAIVTGNKEAIKSLLEVFDWLFDYILEKIGSETSTNVEDDTPSKVTDLEDPDIVTQEVIDSILERELGKGKHSKLYAEVNQKTTAKDTSGNNSTAELIEMGNTSQSKNYSAFEKTSELIALGNSKYMQNSSTKEFHHNGTKQKSLDSTNQLDDLSYGLISEDIEGSVQKYDGFSANAAKETTADLIRESESIENRLGLRDPVGSNISSPFSDSKYDQNPTEANSSHTSSLVYPKPVISEPGVGSSDFAHIGAGLNAQAGASYKDNFANSYPLGHQYHNFTHHLYHHYDPKYSSAATFPRSNTSPSNLPVTRSLESASTQVTPGLFHTNVNYKSSNTTPANTTLDEKGFSDLKSRTNVKLSKSTSAKSVDAQTARFNSDISQSYDNIRYLIQDTMNMSENAIVNSPLKKGDKKTTLTQQAHDDLPDEELLKRLRQTLQKIHSSEDSYTDKSSLNKTPTRGRPGVPQKQANISSSRGILSPQNKKIPVGKNNRKVSFMTSRSLGNKTQNNSEGDHIVSTTDSPTHLGSNSTKNKYTNRARSNQSSSNSKTIHFKSIYGKGTKVRPSNNKQSEVSKVKNDRLAQTTSEYFRKYNRKCVSGSQSSSSVPSPSRRRHLPIDSDQEFENELSRRYDDADYSRDIQAEIEDYKRQLRKRSKKVLFEDILDDSAPGHMGSIRRKLLKEEKKTRFRSEFLKDLYETEMLQFEAQMQDQMEKLKEKTDETQSEYKKKVLKASKVKKHHPGTKYRAPHTSVLLPKSKARNRTVSQLRHRKGSVGKKAEIPDNEILPWLLEKFPYLYISHETLLDMWRKSAKQLELLSKTDQYVRSKKNKAQAEIEEAEHKQKLLADIAKKEIKHNATMREIEERKKQQQLVKASIRDKRIQHARVRKYYDDYHVRMRSKMLKKRTREEMVFKELFEEGLSIQKDRIRDLRKYARDQRESRAQKQRDQLESIENMYRDRFLMLAEALEEEKKERLLKSKAQKQVLDTLRREFRKKTEKEIETIQEQLFRDEDDEYFRQIDADRLRQELCLARYKARV